MQRTFVKRFDLGTLFNRSSNGHHWSGSTVKAFRVLATNNEGFELSMVADPLSQSVQGIPLNQVRIHNYTTLAKSAVVENATVQSGVWVDILFSVEDPFIWSDERTELTNVSITDGSALADDVVDVDGTTPTALFPADSARIESLGYNAGPFPIKIGTEATLGTTDWVYLPEIPVGGPVTWKNSAALYARGVGGISKVGTLNQT